MGSSCICHGVFVRTDIKSEDKNPYIFLIATFGSSPGYCCGYLADLIESKGFNVSAKFSILMVDTWTPVFNLSNEDKINKKTLKSDKQIGDVISKIERKNREISLKENCLSLSVISLEKLPHLIEKPVI